MGRNIDKTGNIPKHSIYKEDRCNRIIKWLMEEDDINEGPFGVPAVGLYDSDQRYEKLPEFLKHRNTIGDSTRDQQRSPSAVRPTPEQPSSAGSCPSNNFAVSFIAKLSPLILLLIRLVPWKLLFTHNLLWILSTMETTLTHQHNT